MAASLSPATAGRAEDNLIWLSSFPVVVTGTLPTLNFRELPAYFEWVNDAEGEYYFAYVFLTDGAGNLAFSSAVRIIPTEVCYY